MKRASTPAAQEIPRAEIAAACRALRCPVPQDALVPLGAYLALLIRWNRVMNLVGAKSWREALRLVADSFFLARFLEELPLPAQPLIWDLGAGAGLPGIPLRMVWQAGECHLVEIREKRAIFLNTALAQLALPRTLAICERAEHFLARMLAQRRQADCVLSRAFMPWKKLLPFVANSLAPDGIVCIAANSPPPDILPDQWMLAKTYTYEIEEIRRFFWALRRNCVPHLG